MKNQKHQREKFVVYDGVKEINAYSRAKTEYGRMLSNCFTYPFRCKYGEFQTIEGLWHYLGYHRFADTDDLVETLESFKTLDGLKCNVYNQRVSYLFPNKEISPEDYVVMSNAIIEKIFGMRRLLRKQYFNLPVVHYLSYDGNSSSMVWDEDSQWLRLLNCTHQSLVYFKSKGKFGKCWIPFEEGKSVYDVRDYPELFNFIILGKEDLKIES